MTSKRIDLTNRTWIVAAETRARSMATAAGGFGGQDRKPKEVPLQTAMAGLEQCAREHYPHEPISAIYDHMTGTVFPPTAEEILKGIRSLTPAQVKSHKDVLSRIARTASYSAIGSEAKAKLENSA